MKGNNGKGNVEERDHWETNEELFSNLNKQYWFNFDCCANEENRKIVNYSNDFLNISFKNNLSHIKCWMNPPFSKAKEMFNNFFKVVPRGVVIYRCDNMETSIWQDVILKNATWILIPKGRVSYNFYNYSRGKLENKSSRFPSAIIGYNVLTPDFIDGTLIYVKNEN